MVILVVPAVDSYLAKTHCQLDFNGLFTVYLTSNLSSIKEKYELLVVMPYKANG
jgi:hypothetical protein